MQLIQRHTRLLQRHSIYAANAQAKELLPKQSMQAKIQKAESQMRYHVHPHVVRTRLTMNGHVNHYVSQRKVHAKRRKRTRESPSYCKMLIALPWLWLFGCSWALKRLMKALHRVMSNAKCWLKFWMCLKEKKDDCRATVKGAGSPNS